MTDWSNARVLVTGADGFIGSHLTETLVRAGAHVRALCLYNSRSSLGWLDGSEVLGDVAPVLSDVRDAGAVDDACRDIDVVFHLAALIAIPYSYRAPESYVDTNIRGTLNVLQAARRHEVGRVVHTSTSEVYGTPESLPITEGHPLQGQSPYSASKIGADMLCESFHRSFSVPVVTIRPFNTYGPRQSARAVLPTILTQMLSGRTTLQLGNTDPKRDLTYVSDTVTGLMAGGSVEGIEGRIIQLGTGKAVSIGELVACAALEIGVEVQIEQNPDRVRPERSEVMVLESDPSLAMQLLGWTATTGLQAGLSRTVDWIRDHMDEYRPDEYAV